MKGKSERGKGGEKKRKMKGEKEWGGGKEREGGEGGKEGEGRREEERSKNESGGRSIERYMWAVCKGLWMYCKV